MRRSLKYIVIIFLNGALLLLLQWIGADKLELLLNSNTCFIETMLILVASVASLIATGIATWVFHLAENKNRAVKLITATLLTLSFSSLLYIDLVPKIYRHNISKQQIRRQLTSKIHKKENELTAENLTIQEYHELAQYRRLPALPDCASCINYRYEHIEDILPDYALKLTYHLPPDEKTDSLYFQAGDFTRQQIVNRFPDKIRVTYTEEKK